MGAWLPRYRQSELLNLTMWPAGVRGRRLEGQPRAMPADVLLRARVMMCLKRCCAALERISPQV